MGKAFTNPRSWWTTNHWQWIRGGRTTGKDTKLSGFFPVGFLRMNCNSYCWWKTSNQPVSSEFHIVELGFRWKKADFLIHRMFFLNQRLSIQFHLTCKSQKTGRNIPDRTSFAWNFDAKEHLNEAQTSKPEEPKIVGVSIPLEDNPAADTCW